jgi:guanylate kinase
MSRVVMLSGPSCVGKGPLYKALKAFYPELARRLKQIVLYNDREIRPGEAEGVDYYFRPRAEIEKLAAQPGFITAVVRSDLQALEIAQLTQIMDEGLDPFFEGNPFIPAQLRESGALTDFPTLTVFLSPLSREEILYLKDPVRKVDLGKFVQDVQRRKLLRRTQKAKENLSLKDLENIEKRSASAIVEMREAWKFDYLIPLYDGEAHENWDAFYYPIGSARKAVGVFAALLRGEHPTEGVEHWEEDLIPE